MFQPPRLKGILIPTYSEHLDTKRPGLVRQTLVFTSLLSAMNTINDPTKRTSINSLLNPQDASAFPAQLPILPVSVGTNQGPPHDHNGVPVYGPSFSNASSFNLRAANWDMSDDATKRKAAENGATAQRQYSHPHMTSGDVYEHHTPRLVRPRMEGDSNGYPIDGSQMWTPQQDVANMPYGTPVIAPLYSDERTTCMFPSCSS